MSASARTIMAGRATAGEDSAALPSMNVCAVPCHGALALGPTIARASLSAERGHQRCHKHLRKRQNKREWVCENLIRVLRRGLPDPAA